MVNVCGNRDREEATDNYAAPPPPDVWFAKSYCPRPVGKHVLEGFLQQSKWEHKMDAGHPRGLQWLVTSAASSKLRTILHLKESVAS